MPALVMIVDDHASIRRMVREVFEAGNWEVLDAANGAEGVQKAQVVKPGLIYSRSVYADDEWTGCSLAIEGAHAAHPR